MEIVITVGELLDRGKWSAFCRMTSVSHYAVSEGVFSRSTECRVTMEQAEALNLI